MALKITAKEVALYRDMIIVRELQRPYWFDRLTDEEVAECYNGVGSQDNCKLLRKALTYIYRFAIPAVVIHDVIWTYAKAKGMDLDDFYESNEHLKENARKCLKYADYNLFYYYWCYSKCYLAEKACNKLGKSSWENLA